MSSAYRPSQCCKLMIYKCWLRKYFNFLCQNYICNLKRRTGNLIISPLKIYFKFDLCWTFMIFVLYWVPLISSSTLVRGHISINQSLMSLQNLKVLNSCKVWFMVFNATFNNISVISWRPVYWWRKPEQSEKTTDLSQVSDKQQQLLDASGKIYNNNNKERSHKNLVILILTDCILIFISSLKRKK